MEGVIKNDDARLRDALQMGVLARELDGGLVGLKARVAEEASAHSALFADLGGHILLQVDAEIVRAVNQVLDLILERSHQTRVIVPDGVDGDACKTIEVALALGVGKPKAVAPLKANRQRRKNRQQMRAHI